MVPTDTISHIAGHRHLQLLKHLCSLFVFVSLCLPRVCLHRFAYVACVCVSFCVCAHASGPHHTQNMRLGGSRRGCTRHPQAPGDWSAYLCGAAVQNRKEERMASDISRQWFHNLQLHQET